MKLSPFLKILRVPNLVLLGFSVVLGFWLSHSPSGLFSLLLLVIAAISCTGFGNVVNDIADIETDRISHPDRPLSRKEISPKQALIFSGLLAVVSIVCSFSVSVAHGIGVVVPLVMLGIYAGFLKGTPLAGNVLVSILVAYGIIFGGLTSDASYRLYIPAILAFLLNLPREIVKDIQDRAGDSAACITTSAVLPAAVLRMFIAGCAIAYGILVFMPFILHHFGMLYAVLCLVAVIPLHVYWFVLVLKSDWQEKSKTISLFIKYEMLCGLCALALDQLFVLRI
jgi:geranylgeranylglycerol-phosphate geranylgeranyltransferase